MFERVVIATDGSPSAGRAVEAALDLASRFDAEVHALSVHDTEREDGEEASKADAADAVADVAARAPFDVTTAVRTGGAATTINEYVVEVDADVVVMGTRGRHGPGGFHLGSVAEAVVRDCPVPVLTVRQLGEDDERPSAPEPSSV